MPKSSIFPTVFFGKPLNIRKVKFAELLPLISCFLRENYVRSWAFPAISLWAQKLNQQPTVKYDTGNQEGAIDNKRPQELFKDFCLPICWKCSFADSIFTTNISHSASTWAALAFLPRIIRHKL